MNQEECICALATPAGGAIGIIRLSGSDAITLTDIADTGNIMPPKTTWFEPKLRSGLFVKLVDNNVE